MKVYLTKILLWKFTMALVFMFWKCSHMYICIFWHNFAGDMGMFSKGTAGGWVDYDMGSRPRRAELLWCRKGDIFCKISWIWIAKFPRCVWSWRCNKLFWFKGTQKSWMHDGSAITEKFQAIWASASGARNWLLGGNYEVQDLEGQEDGKGFLGKCGLQFHQDKLNFEFFVYLAKGQEEGYGHMGGYFSININLTKLINLWKVGKLTFVLQISKSLHRDDVAKKLWLQVLHKKQCQWNRQDAGRSNGLAGWKLQQISKILNFT